MKRTALKNVFILLVAGLLTLGFKVNAQPVDYVVNTRNVQHQIDEKIYGHFLEHIYNSVNGGLWGDLVWNRSFERLAVPPGEWTVADTVIMQSSTGDNIRLLFGETSWKNYEISVNARKDGGNEGFLVIFRADGDNFYWLNIAGWGNTQHAIEKGTAGGGRWGVFDNLTASGSISTGQWYNLKVRCDSNHFQAWMDDGLIFDFTDDQPHLSGQVGLGTWVTQASYANIVVTDLDDGDTLFSGLPNLEEEKEADFDNWSLTGNAAMYSDTNSFNSDACARIENTESTEAGIYQSAFNIIPQAYEGSLWAKGNIHGGLKISLLNGTDTLDKVAFDTLTGEWAEYAFSFDPDSATQNGTLSISYPDTGTVYIDQVSMMGQDAIDNDGYRPDLLEAVRELHPPIIRWPGGCYVSAYFWKDGIGPQSERKAYQMDLWDDRDVNSYGTDEFIQMCEKIGAEPLIVVNTGILTQTCGAQIQVMLDEEQYLQDALDWMEYCNGDPDTTYWGAVRAANGRREPYNVKYWEIDNEVWVAGVSAYIDVVNEFAPAMRAKYPDIKIIACGSSAFDQSWNISLLNGCADQIDYISTHHYEEATDFRTGVVAYENFIATLGNHIEASSNPDIQIYMSEWGLWNPIDWRIGSYAAGMLNAFERQGDHFAMGGPALFLRHQVAGNNWNNALVNFNNTDWFPAPNYVVMKLWHDHYAKNFVETSGSNANLSVVSTISDNADTLYFKVVNTFMSSIEIRVSTDTAFKAGDVSVKVVEATSLMAENTYAYPDNIKAVDGSLTITGGLRVIYEVPAYSASVITIEHDSSAVRSGINNKLVKDIQIVSNSPNPFTDETRISFCLSHEDKVMVRVLDLSGRTVSILSDRHLPEGLHTVTWKGNNLNGNKVPAGIYIYELTTGKGSIRNKMLLMR